MFLRLKFLGHAGFEITLDGRRIIVDPFITCNKSSKLKLTDIEKADIVAVTHSHFDHLGDAIEIAKRDNCTFLCFTELGKIAAGKGLGDVVALNTGGSHEVKGIDVVCTQAFHTGDPCGFVFIGKERRVYHAGDTGLFGDMALIGEMYKPDVALLPIGGYFTMGPYEAAKAAELIRAKFVVPMHYNTFDLIRQDPDEFRRMVRERISSDVIIIKEGESVNI